MATSPSMTVAKIGHHLRLLKHFRMLGHTEVGLHVEKVCLDLLDHSLRLGALYATEGHIDHRHAPFSRDHVVDHLELPDHYGWRGITVGDGRT